MPESAATDGLQGTQRHWAVFGILLGTFLGNLDAAIANIAMPVISSDLGASASTTVWVVNAYQLVMAITRCCRLPCWAIGWATGAYIWSGC